MAGHSKFKNIQHRKGAQDAKRAKLFTKLTREILVAAGSGQPDPEFNPRLRNATATARKAGVPKDRIEVAVKKGSGEIAGENYEEMRYEGYGPGGVALIVEALTDNKNRSASDIRAAFAKHGGNMGETGTVNFMFEQLGLIEYEKNVASFDEIFEFAAEAGAENVEEEGEFFEITCGTEDLNDLRDSLEKKFGEPESASFAWIAKEPVELDLEKAEKVYKLVETLEDNDDVQKVSGNYVIPDDVLEKL